MQLGKDVQLVFARSEYEFSLRVWNHEMMVSRDALVIHEDAASAIKLAISMNPEAKIPLRFIVSQGHVHVLNDSAPLRRCE